MKKKGFLHYFSITINVFNLFYYKEKQEIFLHKKIYFRFNKNIFFLQKRNKITQGQVVVIFIFKKQGKTKRKCSEGKNLMTYLKIDWSRSEPLSLLHYFHLKVQKVSITVERISKRGVKLTVLFNETETTHVTQKLCIIQKRVLHHVQWFPHESFFPFSIFL
jgi:hypothetical protein